MFSRAFSRILRPRKPGLAYLRVLPLSDHALDARRWTANPAFLRFGFPGPHRFLAAVSGGRASFLVGCPPEAAWDVQSKLRSTCPGLDPVPAEGDPVPGLLAGGAAVALEARAADPLAPFNCDDSLLELQGVLEALGAGRRTGAAGILDVWFEMEDPARWRARLAREADRIAGASAGPGAGAALGASWGDVWSALTGGRPPAQAARPAARPAPADQARAQDYRRRAQAASFWRVRIRVAASAPDPEAARSLAAAAAAALRSLSWHNRLAWSRPDAGLAREVAGGILPRAGPWILMTERELAQIVAFPGQECPRLWASLERAEARTAPPPPHLLGDDGEG